jgi:hypothetical protein
MCPYLGRSPDVVHIKEKSAEVIVVESNEPSPPRTKMEVSRFNEGLNVKLFQML